MNLDRQMNNANFTCTGCADIDVRHRTWRFLVDVLLPPYKKRKWGMFPAPLLPFIIIVVRWKNFQSYLDNFLKNGFRIKDPFEQYNLLNQQHV